MDRSGVSEQSPTRAELVPAGAGPVVGTRGKPSPGANGTRDRRVLRRLIILVCTLLAVAEIASSSASFVNAWQNWRAALHLDHANRLSDHLLQAAQNLAFERGRINVLLNSADPSSAQDLAFVAGRRQAADKALTAAMEDAGEFAPALRNLNESLNALAAMRLRVDDAIRLPHPARDSRLPGQWLAAVSTFISDVGRSLEALKLATASDDGSTFVFSALKLHALGLRDAAGQEASLLARAVASGQPLDHEGLARIFALRGKAAAHWAVIESDLEFLGNRRLSTAAEGVRRHLFTKFRLLQDEVLVQANSGHYTVPLSDLTGASLPALDSIAALMSEVVAVTREHVDAQGSRAARRLAFASVLVGAVVLLLVTLAWIVARGIIVPLSRLTRTLYDLADGNINVAVPYMRRRDEVGRIAESLDTFRGALMTRNEAEKALRLSQTQYRMIFEQAAVGIAQVDGEGTIVRANDSLGRAFALPRASIEGMSVGNLFCPLDGPIGDFLLDGSRATMDAPFRRADGATVHGELTKAEVLDDGLEAPLRFILFHDITDRKQIEAELVRLATTDALTETANRRHFLELAERETGRAQRHGHPLSLLMADIDRFKSINDRYGHAAGDAVLKAYVSALRGALRQEDVLGRLGGEEFGILLPDTDMDSALDVAERLRRLVGEMEVNFDGAGLRPTHSIGVAVLRPTCGSFAELMSRADAALYEAKRRGRNCVHASSDMDEGAAAPALVTP